MTSIWIVLVFITLVEESYCQPAFDAGLPLSVNLYEEETTQKDLANLKCEPTADIKVQILSIYPSGVCDPCFAVYRDGTPDYKLYYLPSQGSVQYSSVRVYTFLLGCTSDDVIFNNHTLEVRIRTNEPPYFDSLTDSFTGIDAKSTKKDAILYTVGGVTDPDNDPVFFNLTVEPASSASKYSIGLTDGKIRATVDLLSECRPTVLFIVTVQDNRNAPVGPKYITCTFSGYYTVPYISTLNKEITVSESLAIGDTVGPDDITAVANTGVNIDYVITTFPEVLNFIIADTGLPRIIIDKKLNWEDRFNSIRITVTPENGFCDPESYYLDINVIDANDPPVLLPQTVTVWVYEHDINFNPGFTVFDEDVLDSYSYSIVTGTNSDLFAINYMTGQITASGYDVDGTTTDPSQVILTIQVEDTKGPDTGTATVTINIQDANDNSPVFGGERFQVTAEECATSQALGTILVSDNVDSDLNNNNVVTCLPNSNGNIFVLADCSFWLAEPLPDGSSSYLTVSAVDLGTIPGPLTAKKNATVITTFTPCTLTTPSTMAPTTQPPTTQPPTTTTPTPTLPGLNGRLSGGSTDGSDAVNNIGWIIAACVVGCVALAAAAFLISRFCLPNCNQGRSSKFKPGSGAQNRTNPQEQPKQQNQNQYRSNTQRNMQKPVTPREVKPYEPRDGAEAYRKGGGDGQFNGQQKNVWHGMGQQPGKGFDL